MSDNNTDKKAGKTAGVLDIRNIIGALLGIYGVVLLLMGIFAGDSDDKPGSANLWAGLALVVAAAVFLTWARLRPIVVRETADQDVERPDAGH